MSSTRPRKPAPGGIGVFDSGIGGLTVLKALRATLPPGERLLYLGDTARVPYGTKSDETVVRYALEGARFLGRLGIKALVVACNTMSAVALPVLKHELPFPVVGVIGPGAEAACRATQRRVIGVIGTAATIKSGAYPRAIAHHLPDARVESRACPLFVPLAEEGWVDNDVARAAAEAYLGSLRGSGIDTLVLGCTHYPLLKPVIGATMGPGVALVDSAEATARVVRGRLAEKGLLAGDGARPEAEHFYVTDSSERFHEVGSRFLGGRLDRLELVDISG
ncbi:MAG TPA: glutamate racemase [Candidatus Polarisedimenticolia bacterium]|nr:glutamate racemase [Candidatus Polarisedimenticolia bacterium]